MLEPVELLEADYIPKLLGLSKRYLVIQTDQQGLRVGDTDKPTAILVSAYADLSQARSHRQAIENDRLRSILDLQEENHRKMILDMIEGTRYVVYSTAATGQDADIGKI